MMNQGDLQRDGLLAKLRNAARESVSIERITAYVGQAPLVTTTMPSGRDIIRLADIIPDPAYHQAKKLNLAQAEQVAYWRYHYDSKDVRIAGLIWHQNGKVEVFFGIVLPP